MLDPVNTNGRAVRSDLVHRAYHAGDQIVFFPRRGDYYHLAGFIAGDQHGRFSPGRSLGLRPRRLGGEQIAKGSGRRRHLRVLQPVRSDDRCLGQRGGLVQLLNDPLNQLHRVRRGRHNHGVRILVRRDGHHAVDVGLRDLSARLHLEHAFYLLGTPVLGGGRPAPGRRGGPRSCGGGGYVEQFLQVAGNIGCIRVLQREDANLAGHGGDLVQVLDQRLDDLEVERLGPNDQARGPRVRHHCYYRRRRCGHLLLSSRPRHRLGVKKLSERPGDRHRLGLGYLEDPELGIRFHRGQHQLVYEGLDVVKLLPRGGDDQGIGLLVGHDRNMLLLLGHALGLVALLLVVLGLGVLGLGVLLAFGVGPTPWRGRAARSGLDLVRDNDLRVGHLTVEAFDSLGHSVGPGAGQGDDTDLHVVVLGGLVELGDDGFDVPEVRILGDDGQGVGEGVGLDNGPVRAAPVSEHRVYLRGHIRRVGVHQPD